VVALRFLLSVVCGPNIWIL